MSARRSIRVKSSQKGMEVEEGFYLGWYLRRLW